MTNERRTLPFSLFLYTTFGVWARPRVCVLLYYVLVDSIISYYYTTGLNGTATGEPTPSSYEYCAFSVGREHSWHMWCWQLVTWLSS